MRCNKARKDLTAFLDGELDEKTRAGIEAHLAGCSACRWEREALEKVRDAMESVEAPTLGFPVSAEAILDRARAGSRASGSKQREGRGWRVLDLPVGLRPGVAVATGVLLVAAVWGISFLRSVPLPTDQDVLMVEKMELFENLDLIRHLSLLEGLEPEDGQAGELS